MDILVVLDLATGKFMVILGSGRMNMTRKVSES